MKINAVMPKYDSAIAKPEKPVAVSKSADNIKQSENKPSSPASEMLARSKAEAKVMQETLTKACQTCKDRMYKDGSNDPGVSFKNGAHINPSVSASVVLGHEREHVANEQARAEQQGGEILYQNIKLDTGICPECGKTYISGGTTETVATYKKALSYGSSSAGNTVDSKA